MPGSLAVRCLRKQGGRRADSSPSCARTCRKECCNPPAPSPASVRQGGMITRHIKTCSRTRTARRQQHLPAQGGRRGPRTFCVRFGGRGRDHARRCGGAKKEEGGDWGAAIGDCASANFRFDDKTTSLSIFVRAHSTSFSPALSPGCRTRTNTLSSPACALLPCARPSAFLAHSHFTGSFCALLASPPLYFSHALLVGARGGPFLLPKPILS
jgi:hypothetical protein